MTYTAIAISAVICALVLDYFALRTRIILTKVFWTSYAIILPFQLITNWWLTSRNIVMYDPAVIVGIRVAAAPLEDLLFGFALVLGVLAMWIHQEPK